MAHASASLPSGGVATAEAGSGVRLTVWESGGFAGPNATSTVANVGGDWAREGAFSAEFLALLTVPKSLSGPMAFACAVGGGTARFWLDDHLLCDEPAPTPG